uniref:Homeobox domain-containing protein n=1 Tax=Helicotheca tamesis TaxID=374047 RepID=A0A7S2HT33_9STRA|mmetsp:Transcript_2290/g.3218  ORF Transcript_2290/g.3218 Transcript_2290/m.3218 type:complete len:455 (+) Transcript_2290:89-1453(+)
MSSSNETLTTTMVAAGRNTRNATEGPSSPSAGGQQRKGQRKSSSLPPKTVEYLKSWMMSPEHVAHPYPTEQEKAQIMAATGIELKQLTNWFVNNRKRYWKPRVEARLQQQAQAAAVTPSSVVVPATSRRASVTKNSPDAMYVQDQQVLLQPAPSPTVTKDIACPLQIPQTIEESMFHHFNHEHNDGNHSQPHQHDASEANEVSVGSSCDSDDDNSTHTSSSSLQGTVVLYENSAPESSRDVTEESNGTVTRREVVDVHILKPVMPRNDVLPTIEDVTITALTSQDSVIKSFPNCQVVYTIPSDMNNNPEMVQTCREKEILQLKTHCLNLYIAECHFNGVCLGPTSHLTTPAPEEYERIRSVSVASCEAGLLKLDDSRVRPRAKQLQEDRAITPEEHASKRPRVHCVPPSPQSQRPDYYGENTERWREACRNASHGYCESLPSLEEASHMFGYSP